MVMLALTSGLAAQNKFERRLQAINTMVGTQNAVVKSESMYSEDIWMHGQTLPAVLQPNGMTFWTPQTSRSEKKGLAPYYYEDSLFYGFRNSHWIVGGATHDYGSFSIMPLTDPRPLLTEDRALPFAHVDEETHPDYYALNLPTAHIKAELTGLSHSCIFRFNYEQTGTACLFISSNNNIGEGFVTIDTLRRCIYGYNPVRRIYQGWGELAGISCYFVLHYPVNLRLRGFGTCVGNHLSESSTTVSEHLDMGCYISFDVETGQAVTFKAANSFVGFDGAECNLSAEIPHWDFNRTREELHRIWLKHIAVIDIDDTNEAKINQFYGALYRASFLPHEFSDVDGRYPSFAGGERIMQMPVSEIYYNDYSLWDTYRAMHPLINILWPRKGGDMITSLLKMSDQGGWLPIFPAWNCYTSEMIGDHSLSLIADAYVKGIRNFDIAKAYAAMRRNAFEQPNSYEDYRQGKGRRALDSYLKYGYIPLEDSVKEAFHVGEQTSRTMEYAYDDFVMAQVARALGHFADYKELMKRSTYYRNVIDPRTGYAQGRHVDGSFLNEDNIALSRKFITEGAPCHYTWYAPHDPYGLMETVGGRKEYVLKLDSMFSYHRYWHGNEPCHQVAYMYNYAGQPWKTQQYVNHILCSEYADVPGGLSGNDDAGQISSWYLFSSLGFYPVCPGTPYYMLAAPTFHRVQIHLETGKTFTIEAENQSAENIYIQSCTLNGKPYTRNYIDHRDILEGSTFHFRMGPVPNKKWGSRKDDCPPDVMR